MQNLTNPSFLTLFRTPGFTPLFPSPAHNKFFLNPFLNLEPNPATLNCSKETSNAPAFAAEASYTSRFFKLEAITSNEKTKAILLDLFSKKEFRELWENVNKGLLLRSPIKIVSLSEEACAAKKVKNAHFIYEKTGPLLSSLSIEYEESLNKINSQHCIIYETINCSFFSEYNALDIKLQNKKITKKQYFNSVYKIEHQVAKKTDLICTQLFPNHPELLYGKNTNSLASFIEFAKNQGHNARIKAQADRVATFNALPNVNDLLNRSI